MRVHHVHAGTTNDPNTARLGEGFWRFLARGWRAGFWAGKRAEDRLRARGAAAPRAWSHPYVGYLAGSLGAVLAAFLLAGPGGIAVLLVVAGYAQIQLYLSDYVQHYGLIRKANTDGKPEPMGPQHSWNAPHWYSCAMMLNAPRHSDHHINPARPFPELRLEPDAMPVLPQSLPVMAVIALVPPIWRRVMDHRVAKARARAV
jgi:alkane 1-monooxygenase